MFDYSQKIEFNPGNIIELDSALESTFPVFFGSAIEDQFAEALARATHAVPADRLFLLTDHLIYDLFGERFLSRLRKNFPEVRVCHLPRGERCKTFGELQKLCDQLIDQGVSKRSLLIAFGGGSVGNITGLAAGIIFRGIRFVEVPTTLSHQTDGVLSNKQAINGRYGKNHFGLYHAPIFAWVDTRYPHTERLKFKKSSIVEGIKNGLIDQSDFIPYLEKNLETHGDDAPEKIHDLAYKLMISKLEILKKDPTERNYGIILEYGHTFAHAVEWLSEGRLTHGEAVSIGIKLAAELSAGLGYINQGELALHYHLIDDLLAMKPELPPKIDPTSILKTMNVDNKKNGDDLRFVLLEKVGQCKKGHGDYLIRVDQKIVQEVVNRFIDNY